jgi:hypothetical protein
MPVCHKAGGHQKQVFQDPLGLYIGGCNGLAGGVKKPAAPGYVLEVKNAPDPLFRDDDLTLVVEDDGDTIIIDNA